MKIYIVLALSIFSFALASEADHIIFQTIITNPDDAESISIFNPTSNSIDLSDYYISDAEYRLIGKNYYNLPSGDNFWSGSARDFIVKFPENTMIESGESLIIGINNQSIFESYYGFQADFTILDDMLNVVGNENTIGDSPDLFDNYESLILFKWDGNQNSLVQDIDYFYWGIIAALPSYGVDKTGVSSYQPDTPFDIQENNIIHDNLPDDGECFARISSDESGETGSEDNILGNGITGDDETSEVFNISWEVRELEILGCTDESSCNYISNATLDNGLCEYPDFGYDCDGNCLYDENLDGICEYCPLQHDPFYNEEASQYCLEDINLNLIGDCCVANKITHTIKEIVTADQESHVIFDATILGLIVDFGDYRYPNGGPQVIALQDDDGYRIDLVIWNWDVITPIESSIAYMVDPNTHTEYKIIVSGKVDVYQGKYQFDVELEEDIEEYKSFNLEGVFIKDGNIEKATIDPAPYVIIPTIGERLDYSYSFPSNSKVTVRILDFNGNLITSLVDKYYETGGTIEKLQEKSDWDGKNHLSQIVAPGTYFMHIEATNLRTGKQTWDMAPIVVGVD